MELKDIYKVAYGDLKPFDRENKSFGKFIFALIASSSEEFLNDREIMPGPAEFFLYFISKSGLTINNVYDHITAQKFFNSKGEDFNVDQYLYSIYSSDELFDEINKMCVSSPKLLKDIIGIDIVGDVVFDTLNEIDTLADDINRLCPNNLNKKYKIIINDIFDTFNNLNTFLKDVNTISTNILDEYNISRNDVEREIKKLFRLKNVYLTRAKEICHKPDPMIATMVKKNNYLRIRNLPKKIHGQPEATIQIVNKVLNHAVGFRSSKKPLASLLLTGPTGVGKTETAKSIADLCCDGHIHIVDMSTFKYESDVSRLTGAPAGFKGYGDKNVFCDFISDYPNGVILFDEIDKANPACMDLLLHMIDEGSFINAKGETLDLSNNIIICTTNFSDKVKNTIGFGSTDNVSISSKLANDKNMGIKKEFLARFNAVIEFKRLDQEACRNIAKEFLDNKIKSYYDNNPDTTLTLTYTQSLIDQIVKVANTDQFGARDINKVIDDLFVSPLTYYIIKRSPKNVTLIADVDGKITRERANNIEKPYGQHKTACSQQSASLKNTQ